MTIEIIGLDHIYIAVFDLAVSENFYDPVMGIWVFARAQIKLGESNMFTNLIEFWSIQFAQQKRICSNITLLFRVCTTFVFRWQIEIR